MHSVFIGCSELQAPSHPMCYWISSIEQVHGASLPKNGLRHWHQAPLQAIHKILMNIFTTYLDGLGWFYGYHWISLIGRQVTCRQLEAIHDSHAPLSYTIQLWFQLDEGISHA